MQNGPIQPGTEAIDHQHSVDYRQLLNLASELLGVLGAEGYLQSLNPAWERTLGFSQATLQAEPWVTWIYPEDQKQAIATIQHLAPGTPAILDARCRCQNGSYRWVHWTLTALPSGEIYLAGQDVTEYHQLETALEQVHQSLDLRVEQRTAELQQAIADLQQAEETLMLYKQAVESASDAIGLADATGTHIYHNEAFSYLYDCGSVEDFNAAGGIQSVFADPVQAEEIMQTLLGGQPWIGEVDQVSLAGRRFQTFFRAGTIKDTSGKIVGLMGIFSDITERIQTEMALRRSEMQLRDKADQLEQALNELRHTQAQLVQTEKMSSLGQLMAGVAHEINNPVNFIYGNLNHANDYAGDLLGLLQLYQQHYPDPVAEIQDEADAIDLEFLLEDLPKLLSSMKVGAERIQKIVLSLRNFSRMDESEMKPVDIHEGIDGTLMILQSRLKETSAHSGIRIERDYAQLPPVNCYAGQLNQVFMNILANAIDALDDYNQQRSPEAVQAAPSVIRIRTEALENQFIRIAIADNGPGMPETVRERLFEPFFTTKPVGKGTGLGLSISYQVVVDKHGGSLTCVSEPGQGSEFRIDIPC